MKNPAFLLPYLGTSLATALGIWASSGMEKLAEHQGAAWVYWVFFVLFVGLAYIVGYRLAHLPNPNTYTQYMLGLIGLKMMLCVSLVFACTRLMAPSNHNHVFIFLFLYVVFSILEYALLSKLAHNRKR